MVSGPWTEELRRIDMNLVCASTTVRLSSFAAVSADSFPHSWWTPLLPSPRYARAKLSDERPTLHLAAGSFRHYRPGSQSPVSVQTHSRIMVDAAALASPRTLEPVS